MKKLYILLLTFAGVMTSSAQTFYSENMGVPTANTLFPAYTTGTAPATFQNSAPITYTGTGDVRTSLPSAGYTGFSAGGNVFLTGTAGRFLQISGLNSSAYLTADLQLSFGYNTSNITLAQLVVEVSTNGTVWTPLTFAQNPNTSWNLVTIGGGQIPSSATLSIRFTQPATAQIRIDDVKLTNASASCTLVLGTPVAVCDASTSGLDTYTTTIPYTGGGAGTYVITPNSGSVGGNNPNTVAAGNIVISGTAENTALTLTVIGSTCNLSTGVNSPECKAVNALPYSEPFPYTIGNSLGAEQKWTNVNSGDNVLVVAGNLSYTGITPTGNSVSFSGAGIDTFTPFTSTTAGFVYTSFLMNVTDMSNVTVDGTETVFATVTDDVKGFKARIFIKKNGTQFQIGCTSLAAATPAIYDATLYNVGSTVLVITGYDFSANELKMWVNPTVAGFTAATPATITETPVAAFANLGGFLLRQDAANNTPTITIDELKAGVTPAQVLAVNKIDNIAGLKVYPNPVTNGQLFITSDNGETKTAEIYNVLGKTVLSTTVTTEAINVTSLSKGIYILKVTENEKTATRKLIIE